MPKWNVTLYYDTAAHYLVEAETEESAIEEAKRISDQENDAAFEGRCSHVLQYVDGMATKVEDKS